MMMKLTRFRVTNFRSIVDSGWIETDSITALIGTNESGKTNLLVALWKLNPVREGKIEPMADYPRKNYGQIKNETEKPTFITAEFELHDDLAKQIAESAGRDARAVRRVVVARDFDGNYTIEFPDEHPRAIVARSEIRKILTSAVADVTAAASSLKADELLRVEALERLRQASVVVDGFGDDLSDADVRTVRDTLGGLDAGKAPEEVRDHAAF
jgi:hypothetical protein